MTVRPVRLQLSRAAGFDLQAVSRAANGLAAVNCARPGPWGNLFRTGEVMTDSETGATIVAVDTSADAVALHRRFIETMLILVPDCLAPLRGRNLACWCAPDAPCHGDTYLELANR